jgi:sugar phosphate isomerase/epimerase
MNGWTKNMEKVLIGMNFPDKTRAENLEAALQQIVSNGYDCVEFCLSTYPLIAGGEIHWEYVNYVKDIFEKFPLKYTGHIGMGLELRNIHELDLQKSVLKASIDICSVLKLNPLTLHFEQSSMYLQKEKAFLEGHIEAADYAASLGLTLCMENIEVEHHTRVLEMIDKVNRNNFKMTLDTGHLSLSTTHFGYDFKMAVKECAPYVGHIHLSDNTASFEEMRLTNFPLYKTLPMGYRIAFGRGDIHLPPFWGKIPMKWVLETLNDIGFSGVYLCEYENELYVPFQKGIQQNVRKIVTDIRAQKSNWEGVK